MKRLVLMRHAKTEGHHVDGDRARELLPRGRDDAAAVGQQLAEVGLQHAMVSTAVRTRQTYEALGLPIPAEFLEVFYTDGPETMLQRISETDEDVTGLLVIAHEPVIPRLAAELGYASNRAEADALQCSFPPASFVEFTFEGAWADLERDNLEHIRLARVERPVKARRLDA
ncbi:SixA phosphatase family protein [Tessaracoccus sp.]